VGSSSFPLKSFSTLDSKGGFDEVSQKIREEMRSRGQMRRRKSEVAREEDEDDSDDEEKKNL
jgi:glycerol-3-phosphate O-acyltransferase/dihydroxyacetone phosphate acyltransferase